MIARRVFNASGPPRAEDHFTVPAAARASGVRALIERKSYFVVRGPRRTGKTTALLALAAELLREGRWTPALLSLEPGAAFPGDVAAAESAILAEWRSALRWWLPPQLEPPEWPLAPPGARIAAALEKWCAASPRPVVLFLDDLDALPADLRASVVHQIAAGHVRRPTAFPWAIGLVDSGAGPRTARAAPEGLDLEEAWVGAFTLAEVGALLGAHAAQEGAALDPAAIERAFYETRGQPRLVNLLGRALHGAPVIGVGEIVRAAEQVLASGHVLLPRAWDRLREPRVRALVEPILAGTMPAELPPDDHRYAADLGFVSADGALELASPLVREAILRTLASSPRGLMPPVERTWLRDDGTVDRARLAESIASFWRHGAEPLFTAAPYQELARELVLIALLDRAGAHLEHAAGAGRGRLEVLARLGSDAIPIVMKSWRDREKDPLQEGLRQLDERLSATGLPDGWLVLFDRRAAAKPIADRTASESWATPTGRAVTLLRG